MNQDLVPAQVVSTDRCDTYRDAKTSLTKMLQNGNHISEAILNNILALIKCDANSQNEKVKIAASDMLVYVLDNNLFGSPSSTLPCEIYRLIEDSNHNCDYKNIVSNNVEKKIASLINETTFNIGNTFSSHEPAYVQYIMEIICIHCQGLESAVKKHVISEKVIPEMFNTSLNNNIRDKLIDLAFSVADKNLISTLTLDEVKIFIVEVIEKYIKCLEVLRERNYCRWHDLWIFLVRYSSNHLHSAMDLANKLLRVVEYAFRNPSYEQRLRGYDCWKELIDNASLDMNHMCSPKQIKLLVTPLKAKFSKMEVVICKRFDVFIYLLEKLQDRAVLCLTEFLEFCFGPLGKNGDHSKNSQGKLVPQIWLKSIEVLLALIGQEYDAAKYSYFTSIIKFNKPVINKKNFSIYGEIIIHSIGESCCLLRYVTIESEEKAEILYCLWFNLFKIMKQLDKEVQQICFKNVATACNNFLKIYKLEFVLIEMMKLLISIHRTDLQTYAKETVEIVVKFTMDFIFKEEFTATFIETMTQFNQCYTKEDSCCEFIISYYSKEDPTKNYIEICELWISLCEFASKKLKTDSKLSMMYLMWPVYHIHKFIDPLSITIRSKWIKAYNLFSGIDESITLDVVQQLKQIYTTKPELSYNIACFIGIITQFQKTYDPDWVTAIMGMVASVISSATFPKEGVDKLYYVTVECMSVAADMVVKRENEDLIINICDCIENYINIQNNYKILDAAEKVLEKFGKKPKLKGYHRVRKLVQKLVIHDNSEIRGKCAKIATSFNSLEDTKGGITRSAKIAQMVTDPSTSKSMDKVNALRLFGKDVDTMSPLKVKGSLMNNSPAANNSRSKKMITAVTKQTPVSLQDEKSSDFAVIKTEIKFEPDKMNDHQKEVMKRRRIDIPAMYEDLTQSESQSQDLFKFSSGIPEEKKDANSEDLDLKPKFELKPFVLSEMLKQEVDEPKGNFIHYQNIDQDRESDNDTEIRVSTPLMNKIFEDIESNTDSNDSMKRSGRKSTKIERELMKIQMDIVGGESFLESLPSKRPRKVTDDPISSNKTPSKRRKRNLLFNFLHKQVDMDSANEDSDCSEKTGPKDELSNVPLKTSSEVALVTDKLDEICTKPTEVMKPVTLAENIEQIDEDIVHETQTQTIFAENVELQKKDVEEKKDEQEKPIEAENANNTVNPQSENIIEIVDCAKQGDITGISKTLVTDSVVEQKFTKPRGRPSKSKGEIDKQKPTKSQKKKNSQSKDKIQKSRITKLATKKTKSKANKLIFIREVARPKHSTDTKVSAGSLKINRDKTSSNISYSIEPPDVSNDLITSFTIQSNSLIEESAILRNDISLKQTNEQTKGKSGNLQAENVSPESTKRKRGGSRGRKLSSDSKSPEGATVESSPKKRGRKPKVVAQAEDAQVNSSNSSVSSSVSPNDTPKGSTKSKRGRKPKNPIEPKNSNEPEKCPETPTKNRRGRSRKNSGDDLLIEIKPRIRRSLKISENLPTTPAEEPSVTNKESEDIIESSQESFMENTVISVKTSPKKRNGSKHKVKSLLNEIMPTIPIEVTPSDESKTISVEMSTPSVVDNTTNDENKVSQPDTETCEWDSEDRVAPVLQLQIPEKREFTDSEKALSNMDTMSLLSEDFCEKDDENSTELTKDVTKALDILTDVNDVNIVEDDEGVFMKFCGNGEDRVIEDDDLPSSPINPETPTRTKELLNNTMDISPITSQNGDPVIDDAMQMQICGEVGDPKNFENIVQVIKSVDDFDKNTTPVSTHTTNLRANKLLSMVNIESPTSHRMNMVKGANISMLSPATNRIKKLMATFQNKNSDNGDNQDNKVSIENMLTFSREIPSPLAVPGSSILKRKFNDTDDCLPCAKRKRVNFSDPCISSKKLYIRHKEEYNYYTPPLEPQVLFGDEGDLDLEDEDRTDGANIEDYELETPATEESMDITNALLLCSNKPIYPKLVNCDGSLSPLWKKMSSPMYSALLKKKLADRNIKTVSDLANLTESDINRLPFRKPAVKNVLKALNYYFNVIFENERNENKIDDSSPTLLPEKKDDDEIPISNVVETVAQQSSEECPKRPVNLGEEFRNVLMKMKEKGVNLEEFGSIFLDMIDESHIIRLLQIVYNTDINALHKDVSSKEQSSKAQQFPEEEQQIEEVSQIVQTKPDFIDFLKEQSIQTLFSTLEECIDKGHFTRENLLKDCMLPLVKVPSDIKFYFNALTVAQIHDLFVERINTSDLKIFMEQITESYGNYTIALSVDKKDVLKICSKEELTSSLCQKQIDVGDVKNLITNIQDQNELVDLFKFIGNLLPFEVQINVLSDYLKCIPKPADKDLKLF